MTFFIHNVHYIMLYAFPRDFSIPKYVYMNTRTAVCLYRIYKTEVIINKRESNQTNSQLMDFYNNDHYLL